MNHTTPQLRFNEQDQLLFDMRAEELKYELERDEQRREELLRVATAILVTDINCMSYHAAVSLAAGLIDAVEAFMDTEVPE